MTDDRTFRCFDAFPYAERQNQRMFYRGSRIPGWYPSMVHIFPMIVCRVLPVAGMYRPVTYCRTLGSPAGAGRPEVWLGGYEAVLLMDPTGWPVFRIERIFIPPEMELSAGEVLGKLVEDGRRIATGLGVRRFQVLHLDVPPGRLPAFPVDCGPFGPLPDARLGAGLAELGFSPLAEYDYLETRMPAGNGSWDTGAGRTYRWGEEDLYHYCGLWTGHCSRHREDYHFLAANLNALDPHLQRHMTPGETLPRIRFLGGTEQPAGFVSWYPDALPALLTGSTSGSQVRLKLGELDPAEVETAKVFKCVAPLADPAEEEELLASGLAWAMQAAAETHTGLKRFEAGPVPRTQEACLAVLQQAGFSTYGRLVIMERHLSRFQK